MSKNVLVLNGSYSEIPLIKAVQNLGYKAIVLSGKPDGHGHKIADKSIFCDYSNKEAVLKIAKEENIYAIVSGCHDFSLLTTCWVCEKLNLKGHDSFETSEIIHIKDKFRQLVKTLNIKTPKSVICKNKNDISSIVNNLVFPVMIKAVDLTTGHGMTKCSSIKELESAISVAMSKTRKNYVIAEEFIEGSNHGFTTLIQNQKVVFYFVDNEQHNINQYLVSGASTTTKMPKSAIDQLIKDCNKIAEHLKLVDGILHLQFILDKNNIPTIIEATRRAPGDLYTKFVELATGINYSELIVKAEMGLDMGNIKQCNPKNNIVRHCIMSNNTGLLKNVIINNNIKSHIKDSFECWKKGDIISNEKLYKAGICFIYFDTEEEMDKILPSLNDLITIKTESIDEKNI